MTQRELDRQVARATGETLRTIARRGFSLVEEEVLPDIEPCRPPLVLDWDDVQGRSTCGSQPSRCVAA